MNKAIVVFSILLVGGIANSASSDFGGPCPTETGVRCHQVLNGQIHGSLIQDTNCLVHKADLCLTGDMEDGYFTYRIKGSLAIECTGKRRDPSTGTSYTERSLTKNYPFEMVSRSFESIGLEVDGFDAPQVTEGFVENNNELTVKYGGYGGDLVAIFSKSSNELEVMHGISIRSEMHFSLQCDGPIPK